MADTQPITAVIFRKWPVKGKDRIPGIPATGDIIALFPLEPATNDPYTCCSYERIGQHGAADPGIVNRTKAATPAEYADLKAELERYPYHYNLKVLKRIPRNALAVRREKIKAQNAAAQAAAVPVTPPAPKPLTPAEAYTIASSWGSLVRDGDPGAVFYTFSGDKALVQDEAHRAALLAYTTRCYLGLVEVKRDANAADLAELVRLRDYFATAQAQDSLPELDAFTTAYIAAALWSSSDESDERGGAPLDQNYTAADITPETLKDIIEDCTNFQRDMHSALHGGGTATEEQAGHDFWLTRNHHGAGFWDRGGLYESFADAPGVTPNADALTKAAHRFGECDLYVGDDGKLYI